jgi:pyruvate dehydrogenase E1 component alpha subunit
VDGNEVLDVLAAASEAVSRAREEHEPTFLECLTYRHYGHSKSDPGAYRTKDELAAWKERDPLRLAGERLSRAGLSKQEVEEIAERARARVDDALDAALAADFPVPEVDAATEYAA